MLKSIQDLDIKQGQIALVRSSLNVPVDDSGDIISIQRIKESIKTINYLKKKGAKVIVISHFGRKKESLINVYKTLSQFVEISFVDDLVGRKAFDMRKKLKNGEALLLENTRTDEREKEGDNSLVEEIIQGVDFFVFDDFSVAHRKDALVTKIIDELDTYCGISFLEEVNAIKKILFNCEKPSIAFLAGLKANTKLPILKDFLQIYSKVFVGGVLANIILKEKGFNVGKSIVEDIEIPKEILDNNNLIVPNDFVVMRDKKAISIPASEIMDDDFIVDVGQQSICDIVDLINEAKTIVWNGPLGLYEKGFVEQSLILSKLIGNNKGFKLLGGGDTAGLIISEHQEDDWSFISTGGGSLLTFLKDKTLPVIDAINSKRN